MNARRLGIAVARNLPRLLMLSLPLGLILPFVATLRWESEDIVVAPPLYGCPLPWIAWGWSSGEYVWSPPALAIDALFGAILIHAALLPAGRRLDRLPAAARILGASAIWIVAGGCLAPTLLLTAAGMYHPTIRVDPHAPLAQVRPQILGRWEYSNLP